MGNLARSLRLHGGLPAATATELERGSGERYVVQMDDAEDTADSSQIVGFTILDKVTLRPIDFKYTIQLIASLDQQNITPSTNTKLRAIGVNPGASLLAGDGTDGVVVETDDAGRFQCTAENLLNESVWFSCSQWEGTDPVGCSSRDTVEFNQP